MVARISGWQQAMVGMDSFVANQVQVIETYKFILYKHYN